MARIFRGRISGKLREKLITKRNKKGLDIDSIGYRLELFRIHLGLKAQDMAEHLSVTQGSYSDIQAGHSHPSCQTLINIASLQEDPIDIRWLLLGDD